MQTISEEYLEKPESRGDPKEGHKSNLKPVENIRYTVTLNQIHLNLHNKGLFISVPISQYTMCSFQQKIKRHAKGKRKHSMKGKADLYNQALILKLLDRVVKLTVITVLRVVIKK